MTIVTIIIGTLWGFVVLIERRSGKIFFQNRISKRAWNWIPMHALIICWILMAHMGLVFFFSRLPFETELNSLGNIFLQNLAFLKHLPPERTELVTYIFDINLIVLALLFGYEQYKLGYNLNNKPWPRKSFYYILVTLGMGFGFLGITI